MELQGLQMDIKSVAKEKEVVEGEPISTDSLSFDTRWTRCGAESI